MGGQLLIVIGIVLAVIVFGLIALIVSLYKKVPQGKALIKTGMGGIKVSFDQGQTIVPVIHKMEIMDISVKKLEISRLGKDGLICKDNIRADIKVAFFVRVNQNVDDVKKVAQTIGCERASDISTLTTLFEAKFSEALKTAGKRFNFVQLYDSRADFKREIVDIIGTELNGYILDDCAIDYLEQTPLQFLKTDNILDAEGIKKITDLTAIQNMKANEIRREEQKTIKEQDVEAREAILELERQLAEKEERQKREILNIKAREKAEIDKINEEELLKSERARIAREEEVGIAEANKQRQIIVALKNKERTEAIENERVEKDRLLELNEKERIVTLAQIEKEKAIEDERKKIQDIIKERIVVDKKVAEEEEKIKDLRALAEAERQKQIAIKEAEMLGESQVVESIKKAEADKLAAEVNAKKLIIDADAKKQAALKEAEARKINAEALAAEEATIGLSEAQVIEAKAQAKKQEGLAEAEVLEQRAIAEAKGIKIKAQALREEGLIKAEILKEQGLAEAEVLEKKALANAKGKAELGLADAKVIEQKALAEAKGIEQMAVAEAKGVEEKALAMQKLDAVGKEHEEFKLRLEKEKAIELAQINIQREVAEAQALVLAEALKSAKIELVGGESQFFNNIMNAVKQGKTVDRLINTSEHLSDLKTALIGAGEGNLLGRVKDMITEAGLNTNDVKNLTIASLLYKLQSSVGEDNQSILGKISNTVKSLGIGNAPVGSLI